MSDTLIAAAPDWSLERAAMEMSKRHIRHLVVVECGELVGRPLDARHRARLDHRGRDLGDDVARDRGDGVSRTRPRVGFAWRGWAGARSGTAGSTAVLTRCSTRQAADLVAGLADPGPQRGEQEDRAGDRVRASRRTGRRATRRARQRSSTGSQEGPARTPAPTARVAGDRRSSLGGVDDRHEEAEPEEEQRQSGRDQPRRQVPLGEQSVHRGSSITRPVGVRRMAGRRAGAWQTPGSRGRQFRLLSFSSSPNTIRP